MIRLPSTGVRRLCAAAVLGMTVGWTSTLGAQEQAAPPAGPTMSEGLTLGTLDAWHAFIRPSADERRWLDVAWRTSFWQGVLDSQREGKPILLWAMNGHPIGCT